MTGPADAPADRHGRPAQRLINEADASRRPAGTGPARRARRSIARSSLIKDAVLRMGALVEDAIREASRALTDHDAALALEVIKGDAGHQRGAARASSRLISVTIATQQPVARDLRYLLTLDHVTYELERMGDHAASVAKQVIKLAPEPPLERVPPPAGDGRARGRAGPWRAPRAGRLGRHRGARDRGPSTTRSTGSTTRRSTRSSSSCAQDPANVERGTRIIIASHYLERIGDRVTNIAEDIVYLVTGDVEDLNP